MTDTVPASAAAPATDPKTAVAKPKRPWRDNLEAFGVAILAAVLLKPMVIEAYQIPTSSMQPTLMGSAEAGVFDRILVDKLRYEVFEPERWDPAVFRYPIRRNQNYVKRIVGVGGDRLRIAGGNLWHVDESGEVAHVHRKPDAIQAGLWKTVYPLRREIEIERGGTPPVLAKFFEGTFGTWTEDGEALIGKAAGRAQLTFTDLQHRGLANQIYDGYPSYIAAEIMAAGDSGGGREGVQDVRFGFTIVPTAAPEQLTVELRLEPAGHPVRRFQLRASGGKAVLRIQRGDEEVAVSEAFDCALAAGEATHLTFAHLDDRLLAAVDGDEAAQLEVGDARVLRLLEPGQVSLRLDVRGAKELRLEELQVERDLHYVTAGIEDDLLNLVPEGMDRSILNHVIQVPADHFLMMGDNTLASADSRQWKVLSVGVTEDGTMVDPLKAQTDDSVRVIKGNKRPWDLNGKPDVDENPVIVRSPGRAPDRIAFTDDNGEVFALEGKLGPAYDPGNMQFLDLASNSTWTAPEQHIYFVPREHVLGRPVLGFWPVFSPFRLGFIR